MRVPPLGELSPVIFFFKLKDLFLFCVCVFAHMYVYAPCMYLVPAEAKRGELDALEPQVGDFHVK